MNLVDPQGLIPQTQADECREKKIGEVSPEVANGVLVAAALAAAIALGAAEVAAVGSAVYRGYQGFQALGRGRALVMAGAASAPQISNLLSNVYSMATGDPTGGGFAGAGMFELSAASRSAGNFANLSRRPMEFIFDGERFVMGFMKHENLAAKAGMCGNLRGGTIWQNKGKIFTNEMSGSYHRNWTDQARQEFKSFMSENGVLIKHKLGF